MRFPFVIAGAFVFLLIMSIAFKLMVFKYELCRDRGYSPVVCFFFAGSR